MVSVSVPLQEVMPDDVLLAGKEPKSEAKNPVIIVIIFTDGAAAGIPVVTGSLIGTTTIPEGEGVMVDTSVTGIVFVVRFRM